MKKVYLSIIAVIIITKFSFAQTNTFPSSGNVGIGTTSAGALLTLNSTTYPIQTFMLNNQAMFTFAVAGGYGYWAPYAQTGDFVFRSYSTNMLFTTNGGASTMLALTPSGNVGIGTTNPLNALHIFNNGNFNGGSIRFGYSGASDAVMSFGWNGVSQDAFQLSMFPHNSTTGATNFLTIFDSGFMGVGTTNPQNRLDVNGGLAVGSYAGTNTAPANGLMVSGSVLIGRTTQNNTSYILDVNGAAHATSIVVNGNGADFVFAPKYKLAPLSFLEKYINQNHHLPEIPSAKEMQANGLDVGENETKLLQKVEELTLYLIEKDKQLKTQQAEIDQLKQNAEADKKKLEELDLLKKQVQLLIKTANKN